MAGASDGNERTVGEWFIGVQALDVLADKRRGGEANSLSARVQVVLGQVYVPAGPDEQWTDEPPPALAAMSGDHLLPVCRLMGEYFARDRLIKIYRKGIEYCAHVLGSQSSHDEWNLKSALETITRSHEHAHALVHLGAFPGDGGIDELADESSTFVEQRTREFLTVSGAIHEALAQTLTWLLLQEDDQALLREIFRLLMTKQPPPYQLPDAILEAKWNHIFASLHALRTHSFGRDDSPMRSPEAVRELLALR